MAREVIGYEGVVWTYLEKRPTFSFTNWKKEHAKLYVTKFEFSTVPELALFFQGQQYIVNKVIPLANEKKETEPKKKLQFILRTVEDVRLAKKYFTAVATRTVVFFVNTEEIREQIMSFASGKPLSPNSTSSSLTFESSKIQSHTYTLDLNMLLEDAFMSLANAQAAYDQGAIPKAKQLYQEAVKGFEMAQDLVPDVRSKRLLEERRREIFHTMQNLDKVPLVVPSTSYNPTRHQVNSSTEVLSLPIVPEVVEAPQATTVIQSPPVPLEVMGLDGNTTPEVLSPFTALKKRFDGLQAFSVQFDVEKVKQENSTSINALKLRLQDLKQEKSTVPEVSSLEKRLRALKSNSSMDSSTIFAETSNLDVPYVSEDQHKQLDPIEQMVQQAKEEIALGIPDDVRLSEEEFVCSDEEEIYESSEEDELDNDDDDDHNSTDKSKNRSPS